jgi:hypothetical protein
MAAFFVFPDRIKQTRIIKPAAFNPRRLSQHFRVWVYARNVAISSDVAAMLAVVAIIFSISHWFSPVDVESEYRVVGHAE